MENNEIFELIKGEVYKVIPSAKVLLFGSRANGFANDESDWDVLILTTEKTDTRLKKIIHDQLFPVSIKIAAFINTVIVSEKDWNTDPSYYSLRRSVSSKKVMA